MEIDKFVIIILMVQIIAIILIIISFRFYKNKFLINLIPKLPILTGLLTSTGIILTYLLFSNTYAKNINDTSVDITRHEFRDIYKSMSDNYYRCPNFINSLYFDYIKNETFNKNLNYESLYNNEDYNGEDQMAINYISISIFQSVANYVITSGLAETSDAKWFGIYMGFFSSKELQKRWNLFKYSYGARTQNLVALIIKTLEENKFNSGDDVNRISREVVGKKTYLPLIQNIDPMSVSLRFK